MVRVTIQEGCLGIHEQCDSVRPKSKRRPTSSPQEGHEPVFVSALVTLKTVISYELENNVPCEKSSANG